METFNSYSKGLISRLYRNRKIKKRQIQVEKSVRLIGVGMAEDVEAEGKKLANLYKHRVLQMIDLCQSLLRLVIGYN